MGTRTYKLVIQKKQDENAQECGLCLKEYCFIPSLWKLICL